MITRIELDQNTFEALRDKRKTQFRIPLYPQPAWNNPPKQIDYMKYSYSFGEIGSYVVVNNKLILKITNITIERIQDIGSEDIHAEGIDRWEDYVGGRHISIPQARGRFKALWNKLYEKHKFGWDINPWVFVIYINLQEFEKEALCLKPETK